MLKWSVFVDYCPLDSRQKKQSDGSNKLLFEKYLLFKSILCADEHFYI